MSVNARRYIRAERRRFQRASEGRAWSVKELPQYYYHRNFCDMLTHVSTRYTSLMDKPHTSFIRDFEALPFGAQCAYARLAGRKGRVFNLHHLRYSEIKDLASEFRILRDEGFVRELEQNDLKDYFQSLNKPELIDLLLDQLSDTEIKPTWKKGKLVELALENIDFFDINITDNYVVQNHIESFQYLLFLYFGRFETNLQQKTLGELGLIKPSESSTKKQRFRSAEHAQTVYFYAQALDRVKSGDAAELFSLIDTVEAWPDCVDETTCSKRAKLIQKLGGFLERQGDLDSALHIYARADDAMCNERVIRLRYARNEEADRKWVQSRLEAMIENPESEDELVFAQDFYARKFKKKRRSHVTQLLQNSQIVYLDEAFKNSPERAVKRYYNSKGLEVYRTENRLWQSLFGLLFWDEIYGFETPHPWHVPDILKSEDFYTRYKEPIEAKLSEIGTNKTVMKLLKTMTQNYGQANGLFAWSQKIIDPIKALLKASPPDAAAEILRLMVQNYSRCKDGFPDLMIIENGEVRFVEVKAEGDVLRRNQLTRLRQLRSAGFQADVLRVGWHIDPNQVYVVVDVETTGGRAGLHRVTEIGAVKVQNGEIIDEWSSLINPQRSIPPNITRITGINADMVKDAPVFSDIAGEFRAFMGESIFVAHNVNFDYGFISAEYQMIDQTFRFPKLCTCSSMRKLYPGYRSYGLKNLCQELQIDLKTHHRALCDAKAATELLKMINDKRIELQTDAN